MTGQRPDHGRAPDHAVVPTGDIFSFPRPYGNNLEHAPREWSSAFTSAFISSRNRSSNIQIMELKIINALEVVKLVFVTMR